MGQPKYILGEVQAMTNDRLASELHSWARAREHVSKRRSADGKEPLDAKLLRMAADRIWALRKIGEHLDSSTIRFLEQENPALLATVRAVLG